MAKTLFKSFAGGEITPELFGRVELDKYQTGLQKVLNHWVLPYGPAQNRPGFSYILEAGRGSGKVRLLPFSYSTEQTYMCEFGEQYIRFHTNGATLLETSKVINSINKANPCAIGINGHGFPIPAGWTERANPKNKDLYSVAYGNGLFVATGIADGTDAYIVTSPDGITWTERANPKNHGLFGVTYGGGLFVAVGSNNDGVDAYIVTSPDGITWTERANPKAVILLGVTYGGGLFVAVGVEDGTDAYLLTSPDGITWTERATPSNIALRSVAYGNNLFVALGNGSSAGADSYITTSPDGITWTERSNPKNFILYSVAYGNGLFAAVGEGDGTDAYIVTSPDGITWTERAANFKNRDLYGVAYGGGLFVAVGAPDVSDAYLLTSPDGITWSERSNPKNFTLRGVTYGGGKFVVVGNGDGVDAYLITDDVTNSWAFIRGGGMTEMDGRFISFKVLDANYLEAHHLGVRDFAPINSTGYTTYSGQGSFSRVYEISSPYNAEDLAGLNFTQSADVLTISHPKYPTKELKRIGATNFTLTNASFIPSIATPASAPVLGTVGPGGGTPVTYYYATTALKDITLEESFRSASASRALDLTVVGNGITITPTAVAGAIRYNVYKFKNGLWGYIGQTDGSVFTDNNISPDVSQTPPEEGADLTTAGNYPGCVGYAQGRKVVAGTDNEPQSFFMTRSGTESNMSYSIPTRDDDAINATIKAQEVNRIRHVVPLGSLVLLTTGGAWDVSPTTSDVLTPETVWPKLKATEGASKVRALIASGACLYTEESGKKIIELTYREEAAGLASSEASVLATHLFEKRVVVDAAYAKSPNRTAWYAMDDGIMLGFTYMPEHKVLAWHQHESGGVGFVESIAAVKEGARHVLYAVVRRSINGRVLRYIERMADRVQNSIEDYFFVDCGLSYSGAAATTLRGLWHLEGETVYGLADGAVLQPLVVSAEGTVTLPEAASKVHLGYQITSDFQTLPLALLQAEAAGQGTLKNVNKVYLKVNKSADLKVGPDFDTLRTVPPRRNEPYGAPPALKTEEIQINIDAKWTLTSSICVRHTDPLPLTLVSLALDSATGG